MHFFCRFCLSPAEKAISLEDLGVLRLQSWALRNLGLEMNILPGFSTSVCWACVTTFQNWASMMQDRAACAGDEHLANQENWWEDIPSNSCVLFPSVDSPVPITEEEVATVHEIAPSSLIEQGSACNTALTPQPSACAEYGEIPVIEAIHTAVDTKNCSVIITALSSHFIRRSCQGLVKLSELPKNYPQVNNLLKCLKCNIVMESKAFMVEHSTKKHPDSKMCPYCAKNFDQEVDILKHLTEKVCCKEKQLDALCFFCPKCPEKCNDFSSLAAHFMSRHNCEKLTDWTRPCWKCNHVYMEKKQLQDHFKHTHSQSICRFCKGLFKNNVALMDHTNQTHQDALYAYCYKISPGGDLLCIVCDAKFTEKARISKHFVTYHEHLLPLLTDSKEVIALAEQVQEKKYTWDDHEFKVPVLPEPLDFKEKVHKVKLQQTSPPYSTSRDSLKPFINYDSILPYPKLVKIDSNAKSVILEEPSVASDDATETAKLVKTLKDALPRLVLVPGILQHRKPKTVPPTITSAATLTTYLPAQGKRETAKEKEKSMDMDAVSQLSQSLEDVKAKDPETSETVLPPSDPQKVSKKRKAVSGESPESSKKTPGFFGKSDSTHKCRFCNTFESHYPYSLARHVRLRHKKIFACKYCAQNVETGVLCDAHIVDPKSISENLEETAKSEAAVRKPKRQDLENRDVKPEEKSSIEDFELKLDDLKKSRMQAFKKSLQCPGCNATLAGARLLKQHAISCAELSEDCKYKIRKSSYIDLAKIGPVKCKQCNEFFYQHSSMVKHVECMHSEKSKFSCEKCSFSSNCLMKLRSHILKSHEKIHRVKARVQKKIVKRAPRSAKKLFGDKNAGGKSEGDIQECLFCYSTFTSLENLELHCLKDHPASFRFICRLCPEKKRFMFQASLDKHIKSEHEQPAFRSLSEETSSSPENIPHVSKDHSYASPVKETLLEMLMSEDTNSEVDEEKHKCESCDRRFVDEESKQQHFKAFHERKYEPLPCIMCNKLFSSRVVLKIHAASCRGRKKQKVSHPEETDTKSQEMDKQGFVATKVIFTCSICKEQFQDLSMLTSHQVKEHYKQCQVSSAATSSEGPEMLDSSKPAKQKIQLFIFRCRQCTKAFVNKEEVLEHLIKKHGATDFFL